MTGLPLCACGCGHQVKKRRNRYASRGCWGNDPQFKEARHRRAVAAGIASREAYAKQAIERGARYPTKKKAYVAGYETGYYAAYRFWKSKYRQLLAEVTELRQRRAA